MWHSWCRISELKCPEMVSASTVIHRVRLTRVEGTIQILFINSLQHPSGRVSIWEFFSASSVPEFTGISARISQKFDRCRSTNGRRDISRWCCRLETVWRTLCGRTRRGGRWNQVSYWMRFKKIQRINGFCIFLAVPTSSREEKENWIRRKYEGKEFLPPLNSNISIGQQLIESVVK